MKWLARLKKISEPTKYDATKTTKRVSVVFVAPTLVNIAENHGDVAAVNDQATTTTVLSESGNNPVGTRRPAGMSPKLQAASLALDARIVASGLSLTPPEQPKPKLATSSNTQVEHKADAQTPKPPKVKHVDRPWKTLATAYYLHHGRCVICQAAGLSTRYKRCGTGQTLWDIYQAALE